MFDFLHKSQGFSVLVNLGFWSKGERGVSTVLFSTWQMMQFIFMKVFNVQD